MTQLGIIFDFFLVSFCFNSYLVVGKALGSEFKRLRVNSLLCLFVTGVWGKSVHLSNLQFPVGKVGHQFPEETERASLGQGWLSPLCSLESEPALHPSSPRVVMTAS